MRPSRVLLLASAVTGLFSVVAALLSMEAASLQYGLVMLLAVWGYVVVAGRTAVPRVRWALVAGIALLAVVMAATLYWYREPVSDVGWRAYGSGSWRPAASEQWQRAIDRAWMAAAGLLLGVLCLAAGVLALPARHRSKRRMLSLLLLLLPAVFPLATGGGFGRAPMLEVLGTAWPALLGALVAIGMVAFSVRRADRAWLVAVGWLLLAMAATTAFHDLAAAAETWWMVTNPPGDTFLQAGVRTDRQVAVIVSTDGFRQASALQVSEAWERAVALVGPALVAIGAVHRSRDAGAVE